MQRSESTFPNCICSASFLNVVTGAAQAPVPLLTSCVLPIIYTVFSFRRMKEERDPEIQRKLQSIADKYSREIKTKEEVKEEKELLRSYMHTEREAVAKGKKPFFLKKSTSPFSLGFMHVLARIFVACVPFDFIPTSAPTLPIIFLLPVQRISSNSVLRRSSCNSNRQAVSTERFPRNDKRSQPKIASTCPPTSSCSHRSQCVCTRVYCIGIPNDQSLDTFLLFWARIQGLLRAEHLEGMPGRDPWRTHYFTRCIATQFSLPLTYYVMFYLTMKYYVVPFFITMAWDAWNARHLTLLIEWK